MFLRNSKHMENMFVACGTPSSRAVATYGVLILCFNRIEILCIPKLLYLCFGTTLGFCPLVGIPYSHDD